MDLADRITSLQRQKASASGTRTRGVVNIAATSANTSANTNTNANRDGRGGERERERDRSPAVTAAQHPQESSPLNPHPHSPHSPRRSSAGPSQPQAHSQSQSQSQGQGHGQRTRQLFNPDSDSIPMRSRSPPQMTIDHSHGHGNHRPPQPPQRQLFDPRRDDPMRFAVLNNTQRAHPPPSSIQSSSVLDQSSISSYTSSAWTLTSSTGTSHSSAPPENGQEKEKEKDASGKFIEMLKKIYREITDLEKKTQDWDKTEDGEIPAAAITMLKPGVPLDAITAGPGQDEREPPDPLRALVAQHKKLSELYHSMISMILQPVPASMLSFVTKYSLPSRLWTNGINHCLECLRRMSSRLPGAVEHMNEYIYWSYHFYESLYVTSSVEGSFMAPYSQHWIEALGDLARYRMHITARQALQEQESSEPSAPLTEDNLPPAAPTPVSRIDDTLPPSIGMGALAMFDLEPEVEVWRKSSQSWYSMNLKETPGAGKLHHNLGLLTVEVPNEELRGVYHFVKSMTANHPYPASREAILPLFSSSAQNRRNLAEAKSPELFVLLHGMLFTHIQLDNFQPTLSRYLERLQLDGAQEREWIMMAIINVAAILDYGKGGLIKPPSASETSNPNTVAGRKRELVTKMDGLAMTDSPSSSSKMDVDPTSPTGEVQAEAMAIDVPYALQLSMQLAFSTLSFCLRHPFRQSSPFSRPTLNPYITILLTFIASIAKLPGVLSVIERTFPWDDLINFLATAPPSQIKVEVAARAKLTSGCSPLPEDWCLRGMGWLGRRVYEHGFWKTRSSSSSSNSISSEMDVLLTIERSEQDTDGVIEDNEVSDTEEGPKINTKRRWVRLIRAAFALVHYVPGFEFNNGTGNANATGNGNANANVNVNGNGPEMRWELGEVMRVKAEAWKEEERREREEDERRRNRLWSDDDEDDEMEIDVEEEEEEWDSDPEIKALQERRQYLRALQRGSSSTSPRRSSYMRPSRKMASAPTRPALNVRPGYTVLVVDTNILLSALPMITTLIESERWTILIPLAVITELDGLSANRSDLGKAASNASQYITTHIRSHASSLKVQTSRGNYLTTLNIRSENFDLSSRHRNNGYNGFNMDGEAGRGWERNLDDLILRAALWQESHWVDRSALLKGISNSNANGKPLNPPTPRGDEAKVVLLTFDRNLRVKARSRQLHAGDERDLAQILRFESP